MLFSDLQDHMGPFGDLDIDAVQTSRFQIDEVSEGRYQATIHTWCDRTIVHESRNLRELASQAFLDVSIHLPDTYRDIFGEGVSSHPQMIENLWGPARRTAEVPHVAQYSNQVFGLTALTFLGEDGNERFFLTGLPDVLTTFMGRYMSSQAFYLHDRLHWKFRTELELLSWLQNLRSMTRYLNQITWYPPMGVVPGKAWYDRIGNVLGD